MNITQKIKPIIGQECICPDGLGRVRSFNLNPPNNWIQVSTYIDNRNCKWDTNNVELISIPGKQIERPEE